MRNAHKEAIAAGISRISESLMQIYWMAWPWSPSGSPGRATRQRRSSFFYIMEISPSQLILPSELSSSRYKVSHMSLGSHRRRASWHSKEKV